MRTAVAADGASVVLARGIDGEVALELAGEVFVMIEGYGAPVVVDLGRVSTSTPTVCQPLSVRADRPQRPVAP
jgi:hypothetical protein